MKFSVALIVVAALCYSAGAFGREVPKVRPRPTDRAPQVPHGYMEVAGQRQGKFKGAGRSKSSRIPVISVNSSMTGQMPGRKTGTKPRASFVVVIEPTDLREFQSALTTHEMLRQVKVELVALAGAGKVHPTEVITITNAVVTAIRPKMSDNDKKGMHLLEEISFSYQKITFGKASGKIVGQDDWKN